MQNTRTFSFGLAGGPNTILLAILLMMGFLWATYHMFHQENKRREDLAVRNSYSQIKAEKFLEERSNFEYVADRSETLKSFGHRMGILHLGSICRQKGCANPQGKCEDGCEKELIQKGDVIRINLSMLSAE